MGDGLDPASTEINRLNCRPPPRPGRAYLSRGLKGMGMGGGWAGTMAKRMGGQIEEFYSHTYVCKMNTF